MIRAVALMLGSVICWSSVPLFLKFFATDLDAWTVNAARYGCAAVLLLPVAIFSRDRSSPGGCGSIWAAAVIPSAINALGQVGWAIAPYFLDASVMAFAIRASFFFTILAGAWLLPDERALFRRPLFWAGAGVCVAGIVAMFWNGMAAGGGSGIGYGVILTTAVIWGFYGVTVRRFMAPYSSLRSFAVICQCTAVPLVALGLWRGDLAGLASESTATLGLLAVSAIVGIVSAHILMYAALRRLGAMVTSGGEFLMPFFTFCGASWLFGERLSAWQWAGGLAIVAGSGLLLAARRRAAAGGGFRIER